MALNGYDMASYQAGLDVAKVPSDFVIIKVTQGTKYVNPDFVRAASAALTAGKLIGYYHYAASGTAAANAAHFINTVNSYIGTGILILDWEGQDNPNFGSIPWAKEWLDTVKEQTGVRPFVYMSKSVTRQAWGSVAEEYPLWAAQYASNKSVYGYKEEKDIWTDAHGFGAWEKPLIYQYTSAGQLPGWRAPLDLDVAYMSPDEWRSYQRPDFTPTASGYRIGAYFLDDVPYGDRGERVRFLQQLLKAQGYDVGTVDGIFGSRTARALGDFKAERRLIKCTRDVWTALLN